MAENITPNNVKRLRRQAANGDFHAKAQLKGAWLSLECYGNDRTAIASRLLEQALIYLPESLRKELVHDLNCVPTSLCRGSNDIEAELNAIGVADEAVREEVITETLRRAEQTEFGVANALRSILRNVTADYNIKVGGDLNDDACDEDEVEA